MAFPYGSPAQGQHSRFQNSPTSRTMGGNSTVRRTQSFDPGDDGSFPEDVNGTAAQSRGYRPGPNPITQQDELYRGSQSPSFPPRSTSYGSAGGGGYQHQENSPAPPSSRPSYNPQQYGAPQQHYSPQPSSATAGAFSTAYQPYIPAAYQPTNSQYQSSYGNRTHSASSSYSSNQPPPPPPPPRPLEQRYGSRVSPQIGSDPRSQYASAPPELPYRQQPLPPLPTSQPPSTGSPYTPPAPPPPPFSPGRDAFPSSAAAAPPQSHSQRISASRNSGESSSNRPPSLHNQLPLPNYSSSGSPRIPSPAIHRRPVGLNNSLPPTPGTPGPTPPQHSPQRSDTIGRHPQARPLPGPPSEAASELDYFSGSNGYVDSHDNSDATPGYDDLMQEVEAAVMGRAPPSNSRRSPRVARPPINASIDETQATQPLFTRPTEATLNHDASHLHPNGHIGEMAEGHYVNYDAYSDRSDAEAEAGLAAMHMADEQDAADEARRQSGRDSYRRSGGSQQSLRYHEPSSDSDVNIDMDTYGGGFSGNVPYGDSYGYANRVDNQGRPFAETRTSQRSDMSGAEYEYPIPGQEYIHPFAPARVDRAGTGGLSEPGNMPRRLSFEDGDEATLAESEGAYTSGTQSSSQENMPEMFFHPGVGPSRPLPAAPMQPLQGRAVPQLMPAGTYQHPERLLQYDQYGRPTFPAAPDAYNHLLTLQGTPVPRSSSLISHSSTPQTVPPIRSKTDADRAKILKQQQQMGLRAGSVYGTDSLGDPSMNPSAEILGLPEIPAGKRRRFNPSKLSTTDFKKCAEPWALSSIVTWVKEMSEGEADLKEQAIVEGIVALFTHKVPTMNTADAESLGAKVVRSMYESGTLLKEEEWVKFGTADMSGVLFQLTGTGCYSPRVHTEALPGRCYSHHCMRTLKKINLQTQALEPQRKAEDWPTFYKVTKADIEHVDKKVVERQNNLHEIVTTEDDFMDQLNVLRVLYRDELSKWQPPILAPKRKDKFLWEVFGRADAIQQANEDYLLAQLKYRQQEQGPWIVGFSDIFREWIRKAKNAYIEYAAAFPNASHLIRQESDRNILFRQFLDQMRANDRSRRLGWDTYLKAPITRLQRYTLLLSTVHKNTVHDSEEKSNLAIAIEEIKVVTLECDARVAEMTKNVDLAELSGKLQLRPGMDNAQLNLTHLGREIIFQGDLQRMGKNKFGWVDTHAILFDHYLVLAKIVSVRDAAGGLKYEKYDVSKHPIPMDLLVLESKDDPPVIKSTMKGLGTVTTITTRADTPQESRAGRQSLSSPVPGALAHTNTASSVASTATNASSRTMTAATVIDSPKDEKIIFPFRFKHLGRDHVFTLYAPTHQNRSDWCNKIIEAKTRHAASLYKQGAEPFRLRVVADTAFGYDGMSGMGKTIVISGTPLDLAIREVEEKYKGTGPRPNPVCRAAVNCATTFNQPYGNLMVAVGTDYGVYISKHGDPRGWTRAIQVLRVTQIAVLEEFSLFLLISDKSLIAYHLDTVCPVSSTPSPNSASDSARRAPQKLSGTRDVGFFAHGRQKDRTLVFYKKREGASSIFKVLEPIYQKSSTSLSARSRFGIKKGSVEFFRDFDDFYIGSETYTINLFHSSIAISTAKGIEVMNLDKKLPISVPDLKPPDCASIAHRIRDQKPLGMFRLSDSEFLLVFEVVGIYVNKHGDVSRAVVLEFVGKAKQAALCTSTNSIYLILVDHAGGYVEVRNAVNGRLRQMISGRDVRLLDDGSGGPQGSKAGTVKLCMQHPEWERYQVVVEMIVNEGLKE